MGTTRLRLFSTTELVSNEGGGAALAHVRSCTFDLKGMYASNMPRAAVMTRFGSSSKLLPSQRPFVWKSSGSDPCADPHHNQQTVNVTSDTMPFSSAVAKSMATARDPLQEIDLLCCSEPSCNPRLVCKVVPSSRLAPSCARPAAPKSARPPRPCGAMGAMVYLSSVWNVGCRVGRSLGWRLGCDEGRNVG
jgi:hypothetical protein